MTKKPAANTTPPHAPAHPGVAVPGWRLVFGLYVVMLVLGGIATWLTWAEVKRLPFLQVMWHDQKDLSERLVRAMRAASPAVSESITLRDNSLRFTEAWRRNTDGYALERDIAATADGEQSQFRRLQILAARILASEQRGEKPDAAWPGLKKLLDDAAAARSFAHLQQLLIAAWTTALRDAGLDAGTARALAQDSNSEPHGPLAEFLAPRLAKLAASREAAGDPAGAAACRSILYRWLRDWTLEPTTIGARLLAADLLTALHQSISQPGDEHQDLFTELQRWRNEYHQRANGIEPLPLGFGRSTLVAGRSHRDLLHGLAYQIWALACSLGALTAAFVAGAARVVSRAKAISMKRCLAAAICVFILLELLDFTNSPTVLRQMFGDWSQIRYWWPFVFQAGVASFAIVIIAGMLCGRPWLAGAAARIEKVAIFAAMAFSVFVLKSDLIIRPRQFAELESSVTKALDDPAAAIGAPLPADVIEKLRTWNP